MSDDLEEIKQKQRALDARLDAMSGKLDSLRELIIGEERVMTEEAVETAAPVFDRLDSAESDLEEISRETKAAIASTEARADGGAPTKKELARNKARNKLLTTLAESRAKRAKVRYTTIAEEIEQAQIHYETVKDAVESLALDWAAFGTQEDESGKKVVVIELEYVTKELIYCVEEDLARDDLSKKLISDRMGVGAE